MCDSQTEALVDVLHAKGVYSPVDFEAYEAAVRAEAEIDGTTACMLAMRDDAVVRLRAEADVLRAAIPEDPWVRHLRNEDAGYLQCYVCGAWSELVATPDHAPDCAWLRAQ